MSRNETLKKLKVLQTQNLPRLMWFELFSLTKSYCTENDCLMLEAYFNQFLPPSDTCPMCHRKMEGGVLGWLLGGAEDRTNLEWGLVHGEAFCVKCHYPFKVYHYDIAGVIKTWNFALAYHPDELS